MYGRGRRNSSLIARAVSAILWAPAAFIPATLMAQESAPPAESAEPSGDEVKLSDISVNEDPMRAISNEPSASSFGFSKPILETPRTVSFVSEEQITLLGISSADDLTRVVPGVYTNRRWGLQGGVDVRGVSADMYFRGMKRLNMQGHARTSLTGMDSIEVVKGPPSPIFGMGRIGGYTNMTPKAGRAKSGSYLPSAQGFAQLVTGSWDRSEITFGVGGPLAMGEKLGGYYVYGLLEDSPETWVEKVHAKQKILQGATSIDNFIGPFRLEVGGQYQNSNTAGSYMSRVTQDLIDNGTIITGVPLVNLDINGDGRIGFRETHLGSPVRGTVTGTNQPLNQRFPWPTAGGQPVAYDNGFPTIAGIPQTMLDYLNSPAGLAAANCPTADLMRTMPAGGPVPSSGRLPVGFVLNPCTVGSTEVDPRRGPYEQEQDAQLMLFFMDMVYDTNPNFTVKNQILYDRLESYKNSTLPYGERQSIWRWEDKLTVTKRIPGESLPSWLAINSLASVNHRVTSGYEKNSGGDFDYRNDIMAGDGTLITNASFWNQLENDSYETGAPATTKARSEYSETGIGVLFDIDIARKTNLVLGGRYDWGSAESREYERFSQTCTAASPCTSANAVNGLVGQILPDAQADGSDKGASWSASISHKLPFNLHPYVTLANSSIVLDSANNIVSLGTVTAPGGFIGDAELKEAGIKGSFFNGKLMLTAAGYEQTRTDLSQNPDDPTAGADVTSTQNTGVEVEVKWVPTRDIFVQAYALQQKIEYIFASSANVELTGRQLGFQDVLDPVTGAVLYPAEAFLYGGRLQVTLPAALRGQYLRKNGNPEKQYGLNASWQISKNLGVNAGVNHFSEIPATRMETIILPASTIVNAGISWTNGDWYVQAAGTNLADERYYRPRNGDTVSGLMSSMPGRGWSLTFKHDFR
jgi:outer membrane receptor protein involved in Fe transport